MRGEKLVEVSKTLVEQLLFHDTPGREVHLPDDVELEEWWHHTGKVYRMILSSEEWEELDEGEEPELIIPEATTKERVPEEEVKEKTEELDSLQEDEDPYGLGEGLKRTHELVTQDRNDTHGDPYDNHK